jgi:transcriptional regulator with XRE-family HTH domain
MKSEMVIVRESRGTHPPLSTLISPSGDKAPYAIIPAMKIDRDRLRQLIKERGTTARAVSRDIGTNDTLIRDILSGKSANPQAITMARIAEALGVPLAEFFSGAEPSEVSSQARLAELPLIGPVQAGAWLALDDTGQEDPPMMAAAADRRYPHAKQWLREVRGDSMNARNIYPGDLVHLVDLISSGVNLNTGMIVEVTRTRAGGALREITLKEVEVTDDGLVLWPRSTNARWKDPIRLDDGRSDDIEVEVTGLLIAKITRF